MHILKKEHTRLRVKAQILPISSNGLIVDIDAMNLPEGHLACPICQGFKFEPWIMLDTHKIECGCTRCGWSCRLALPFDVDLSRFGKAGRFSCLRIDKATGKFTHQDLGMIVIHNSGTLCIGCEACKTEVRIRLKSKLNLVSA